MRRAKKASQGQRAFGFEPTFRAGCCRRCDQGPRRRRVVSEAERERLADLSRKHSPFRQTPISDTPNSDPESHDDTQAA
jgi:hypothetical protein